MALPEDFYTNKYLNPPAFNSNTATPLTVADGKGINDDFRRVVANSSGDVVGPASSVDGDIAIFDGTTGKLIADSGVSIASLLGDVFEGAIVVDCATTAALPASTYNNGVAGVGATLTKNSGNYGTIDGVTAVIGRTYGIKDQASALQNGPYELTLANELTRLTTSDDSTEFDGQVMIVAGGTVNKRKIFSQTTALPTVGTDSIVYAQTAAAAGIGAPVSLTRDQARARVLAASFTPGRTYIVTNAMAQVTGVTIDCQIWLIAESTNRLATRGTGLFKNSVMAAQFPMAMDYQLGVAGTDDLIPYLYQAVFNNAMYFKQNYKSIDKFYFDTGNMENVLWNDAIATAIADTTITNSTFGYNANITISNTAVCTYSDIGASAVLSLVSTATITKVSIGAGATLSLDGSQTLTDCKIGNGKTLDATSIDSAYSATGKVYDGDMSTFVYSGDIDLDGLTGLNISNIGGGSDYSFCGIFTGIKNNGSAAVIVTITSSQTDHKYIFIKADGSDITYDEGGNIGTNASAPLVTGVAGSTLGVTWNTVVSLWTQNGDTFNH